jgi:hypothetical protein
MRIYLICIALRPYVGFALVGFGFLIFLIFA